MTAIVQDRKARFDQRNPNVPNKPTESEESVAALAWSERWRREVATREV